MRCVKVPVKKALTNLDVAALAAELRSVLVGARFEKAYQPAKDRILLRARRKGLGRMDLLMELGSFLTITKNPPQNPDQPSMVAKILRQRYDNARIVGVSQVGFDRILRIDAEKGEPMAIILELFGDGNMLLLDGEDHIALPMRGADHGARKLRKGEPYQAPPGGGDPWVSLDAFQALGEAANKDLVRFLALDLGFGPLWAEELCLRADVPKNTAIEDVAPEQWQAVHGQVQEIKALLDRGDLAPGIVFDGEEPIDVVPWPMQHYEGMGFEEAQTFREALDAFFVGGPEADEDPRTRRFEEAKAKIERQVDQMEEKMAEFAEAEAKARADGDALYMGFQQVQGILDSLQQARETRSWQEVDAVLRKARAQGDEAAEAVRELRPHNGTAILRIDTEEGSRDIEVDLYKSVQDNATLRYDAAKKEVSRQRGAEKALLDAKKRLKDLESKGLEGFGAAPKKVDRQSRHFWFETYRWTLTPSGLIAVGGRSAPQNDAVVKKYLREGDRYAHAEIHGAPSIVVRPADGPSVEISEEDLRVACQFAACSSRAWRQYGAASAYWVTPAQVNKTPRSGEFVPKGAWIVHGKRNIVDNLPMEWMVAEVCMNFDGTPVPPDQEPPERSVMKVVGGPDLSAHARRSLRLVPGDVDPNDLAAELAEQWGVEIEAMQQALPPGPARVV